MVIAAEMDANVSDASAPDVTVTHGGAQVRVALPSGESFVLAAATLRAACRCAHCVRSRIDGKFPNRFDDITIVACASIGHYAINLSFSDGHARGIYPWAYLADLARL